MSRGDVPIEKNFCSVPFLVEGEGGAIFPLLLAKIDRANDQDCVASVPQKTEKILIGPLGLSPLLSSTLGTNEI
jgi:hypothetical protein